MSHPFTPEPTNYPYVTRTLLRLFADGLLPDVEDVEVVGAYGYCTRIIYRNGAVRLTYGNDVGLNLAASSEVARDKAYTKEMLKQSGFQVPSGGTILLDWWANRIATTQRTAGATVASASLAAVAYIEDSLAFPVFLKPVDGSKGHMVTKCWASGDVIEVMENFEKERVRVAVVEEAVEMPDFRIVTLDGEVISAYRRVPCTVIGDGSRTLRELLYGHMEAMQALGRPPSVDPSDRRIERKLEQLRLTWSSVPRRGQSVQLHDISNLSAGGEAVDLTDQIHPAWAKLATEVAASMRLRFAGVDIACADLTSQGSEYSIIEVNSAPGLDHYASVGAAQSALVEQMYARVLNAAP